MLTWVFPTLISSLMPNQPAASDPFLVNLKSRKFVAILPIGVEVEQCSVSVRGGL